jgi:Tol biopolymer transport system component
MPATRLVTLVLAAVATSLLVGATDSAARARPPLGTIAFLRFPPGAVDHDVGGPALFTIKGDGTHRLTPRGTRVLSYQWSPDGDSIAYVGWRGSLWIVRSDGENRQLLVGRSLLHCLGLSWSPDGTALAVVAGDPTDTRRSPARTRHLYIVPSHGGEPMRLPSTHVGYSPAWSPTGGEIAYDTAAGEIVVVRIDGTDERYMKGGGVPRWSPDGTSLVFAVSRYASIAIEDADGTDRHRLTDHAYNEYGEEWSPVGRKILYGREDREGIYVIDADGRHDRRVTSDSPIPAIWGALGWSPDGHSILYETDRTGSGDIYAIDVDGRNRVQVTDTPDIDFAPSWAPR